MARRRSEIGKAMDRVQPALDEFHRLSDEDKNVFLDMVDPLPDEVTQPTKPKKRTRKAGKSAKAQSLASAIKGTAGSDGVNIVPCDYHADGEAEACGQMESSGIHDPTMEYLNHHVYQPPPTAAASSAGGG
jgi:hypothetical protein